MDTASHKASDLSILYVDDDSSTLYLFATILTLKYPSVKIYSANNGKSGLELFKQHRQNIVITDLNCTGIDGFKLARGSQSQGTHFSLAS
jgi:CheY-like chemotaxis protein